MPSVRFRLNGVEIAVDADPDRSLLDILRGPLGMTGPHFGCSAEQPNPLQRAFIAEQAMQCGYCVPGILMSAAALLKRNPSPSSAEIKEALDGNLCRCGSH